MWIESLLFAELAYNNSYQSSIGIALFEALHRCKCQMSLYWAWESNVKVQKSGEACIQEMNEKVKVVRENLRIAQNRQKCYAEGNWNSKWEMRYSSD
jgi:hypothetical protein